jgi:hypothetical protein
MSVISLYSFGDSFNFLDGPEISSPKISPPKFKMYFLFLTLILINTVYAEQVMVNMGDAVGTVPLSIVISLSIVLILMIIGVGYLFFWRQYGNRKSQDEEKTSSDSEIFTGGLLSSRPTTSSRPEILSSPKEREPGAPLLDFSAETVQVEFAKGSLLVDVLERKQSSNRNSSSSKKELRRPSSTKVSIEISRRPSSKRDSREVYRQPSTSRKADLEPQPPIETGLSRKKSQHLVVGEDLGEGLVRKRSRTRRKPTPSHSSSDDSVVLVERKKSLKKRESTKREATKPPHGNDVSQDDDNKPLGQLALKNMQKNMA